MLPFEDERRITVLEAKLEILEDLFLKCIGESPKNLDVVPGGIKVAPVAPEESFPPNFFTHANAEFFEGISTVTLDRYAQHGTRLSALLAFERDFGPVSSYSRAWAYISHRLPETT